MKSLEQRIELLKTITVQIEGIRKSIWDAGFGETDKETLSLKQKVNIYEAMETYRALVQATGILLYIPDETINQVIDESNAKNKEN